MTKHSGRKNIIVSRNGVSGCGNSHNGGILLSPVQMIEIDPIVANSIVPKCEYPLILHKNPPGKRLSYNFQNSTSNHGQTIWKPQVHLMSQQQSTPILGVIPKSSTISNSKRLQYIAPTPVQTILKTNKTNPKQFLREDMLCNCQFNEKNLINNSKNELLTVRNKCLTNCSGNCSSVKNLCCYCCQCQSSNLERSNTNLKDPILIGTSSSISTTTINKKYKFDLRKLIHNESIGNQTGKPKFYAVTTLEDAQAIRCAEFHPRGHVYAIGSNSKTLRICTYAETNMISSKSYIPKEPTILFNRIKHHRGSIYCVGWSPDGSLLATGSNDKTLKLIKFQETRREFGIHDEFELSMHDGTIRDLCFIEDLSNKSSLLVSGGAGNNKIFVTDLMTSTPFQAFTGHSAPVSTLYNWGGVIFASGSQDKTIRIWDLRTPTGCVNLISPLTQQPSTTVKSPIGSISVDPTGRLLVSGHEDGAIVLFDIRGNRQVQAFKPHVSDVKSVRFSPNAYYLLSAGYDQRLMLTDLQGDLTQNLNSIVIASHSDRIICARWHPTEFSFVSTSADKTSTLWALPASTLV